MSHCAAGGAFNIKTTTTIIMVVIIIIIMKWAIHGMCSVITLKVSHKNF